MSVSQTEVEQVLVVPTMVFRELGYFQGVCTDVGPYMRTLLDPAYISYRPRDQMETDPSFKQLIPYCIFRCGDRIFNYKRGTAQGEGRLHSKRSIGVGGHICTLDKDLARSPYLEAMHREIDEEVDVQSPYEDKLVGLLNDDQSEVGRVHLGIVHVFEVQQAKVLPREKSMLDAGFATVDELRKDLDQFETWSQLCLTHLFT